MANDLGLSRNVTPASGLAEGELQRLHDKFQRVSKWGNRMAIAGLVGFGPFGFSGLDKDATRHSLENKIGSATFIGGCLGVLAMGQSRRRPDQAGGA